MLFLYLYHMMTFMTDLLKKMYVVIPIEIYFDRNHTFKLIYETIAITTSEYLKFISICLNVCCIEKCLTMINLFKFHNLFSHFLLINRIKLNILMK